MGNIERASTSRSLVRIPISNESLYHATQKKNHGYSTSTLMPKTRALIRAGIDSDVNAGFSYAKEMDNGIANTNPVPKNYEKFVNLVIIIIIIIVSSPISNV